jgi:hypothetical protein
VVFSKKLRGGQRFEEARKILLVKNHPYKASSFSKNSADITEDYEKEKGCQLE